MALSAGREGENLWKCWIYGTEKICIAYQEKISLRRCSSAPMQAVLGWEAF